MSATRESLLAEAAERLQAAMKEAKKVGAMGHARDPARRTKIFV
jgi:hypothetical protein